MTDKTFEPLEIILKKQGREQADIDKISEKIWNYIKTLPIN